MLVSYQWLKEYLGDTAPSVEEAVALLTKHAFEIEGVEGEGEEAVIDVDVLPNRSSDCLSHRGIARELATLHKTTLEYDPLAETPDLPASNLVQADIEDSAVCSRFTALIVEDIKVGPSPQWLQKRLQLIGQKPINNIVDATNYVMYALGQPLHAYDADLFPAKEKVWSFGVRTAKSDETIHLLGEQQTGEDRVIELTGTELLITDANSDTPIGLAGVKGGTYAGVNKNTKRIIIEAAHFDPIRTRLTSRLHNIVIDASKRFENEPSPELPLYAQAMISKLLREIAGGTTKGFYDKYPNPPVLPTVSVNPERVNQLLGLSIKIEEMIEILERLDVTVAVEDEILNCKGPFVRTDLNIEEDYIEEIGRIYGYDHIKALDLKPSQLEEFNELHYYSEKIRKVLQMQGFSEVITSSFRKKDTIKLRNALASDKGCLRSTLAKNLADTLEKNIPHKDILGVSDIRVFEIGKVFNKTQDGIKEHISLGLGVLIKQAGYSGKEDKILAEAKEALGESLGVDLNWQEAKGVAEINLSEILESLPEVKNYEAVTKSNDITYAPFSVYPAISRDVALWVPKEITAQAVAEVILQALAFAKSSLGWNQDSKQLVGVVKNIKNTDISLQRLDLFDTFNKDDFISYAFRLVFQSYEKTLTDEEINPLVDQVYKALEESGWKVR